MRAKFEYKNQQLFVAFKLVALKKTFLSCSSFF